MNSYFSSVDGVLFDKNQTTLLEFPPGVGGSYTLPDTVRSIELEAFQQCTNLVNVTIPSTVTNVAGVNFIYCTALTAITVDPNNAFYSSVDGVLFDKNQTVLIAYPGGRTGPYSIPIGVTNIGAYAFVWSKLTSITIPAGVTVADYYAFSTASLTAVFFQGNAPGTNFQSTALSGTLKATIFYVR